MREIQVTINNCICPDSIMEALFQPDALSNLRICLYLKFIRINSTKLINFDICKQSTYIHIRSTTDAMNSLILLAVSFHLCFLNCLSCRFSATVLHDPLHSSIIFQCYIAWNVASFAIIIHNTSFKLAFPISVYLDLTLRWTYICTV